MVGIIIVIVVFPGEKLSFTDLPTVMRLTCV